MRDIQVDLRRQSFRYGEQRIEAPLTQDMSDQSCHRVLYVSSAHWRWFRLFDTLYDFLFPQVEEDVGGRKRYVDFVHREGAGIG